MYSLSACFVSNPSTGKLYHPAHPKNGDGNASWSALPQQFSCTGQPVGPPGTYCNPPAPGCTNPGTTTAPNPRWCSVDLPTNGSGPDGPELADAKTVADGLMKLRYAVSNRNSTVSDQNRLVFAVYLRCKRMEWCREFRGSWVSDFTNHTWTGACPLVFSTTTQARTRFHLLVTEQPSVAALQCRSTVHTRGQASKSGGKVGGTSIRGHRCVIPVRKR